MRLDHRFEAPERSRSKADACGSGIAVEAGVAGKG